MMEILHAISAGFHMNLHHIEPGSEISGPLSPTPKEKCPTRGQFIEYRKISILYIKPKDGRGCPSRGNLQLHGIRVGFHMDLYHARPKCGTPGSVKPDIGRKLPGSWPVYRVRERKFNSYISPRTSANKLSPKDEC